MRSSVKARAVRPEESAGGWPHAAVVGLLVVAWVLSLGLGWAASAEHSVSPDDVKGPFAWGSAKHVTRFHHLYLADQPDAEGFAAAKAAGVVAVIDLRAPSERDWDEREVVEGLGLEYHNVPVTGDAFDPEAISRIEALVAKDHPREILVHCSSSNRAGGWLAVHLAMHHDLDVDEALAIGRRAGITKPVIEERVRAYLRARPNDGHAHP